MKYSKMREGNFTTYQTLVFREREVGEELMESSESWIFVQCLNFTPDKADITHMKRFPVLGHRC